MTDTQSDTDQIYPTKQVAEVLNIARTSLSYLCKKAEVTPRTAAAKQPRTLCNYYSLMDMAKIKAVLKRKRSRKNNRP